jgi:hypothetical protein
MANRVTIATSDLDAIGLGKMSTDGKDFLTLALDPFHDMQVRCAGLPDSDTSQIVVEKLKQSVTVSAPSGTTGNWAAHVFTLPFVGPSSGSLQLTNYQNGALQTAVSAGVGSGANLYAYADPTRVFQATSARRSLGYCNVDTWTTDVNVVAPTYQATYVAPNASYVLDGGANLTGKRRLIASGFEIHDTTAPQFQQGTNTSYLMPQAVAETMAICDVFSSGAGTYCASGALPVAGTDTAYVGKATKMPFMNLNTPPATVADAMLYTGSRQWHSKFGNYSVVKQDVNRNKLAFTNDVFLCFTDGDYAPPIMVGKNVSAGNPDSWASPTFSLITGTAANAGTTSVLIDQTPLSIMVLPMHTSGVILKGLNVNSTFTVTLINVWEMAPVTGDTNGDVLIPLVEKSADFDIKTLELYQQAATMTQVSVPVDENAEGDFWDWTLRALKAAAPAVSNLLIPGSGAVVSKATSAGIDAIRSKRNERAALQDKANRAVVDNTNFRPNTNATIPGEQGKKRRKKKKSAGAVGMAQHDAETFARAERMLAKAGKRKA